MSTLPTFLFLIFLLGAGILLIQQVVFWGLVGIAKLRSRLAVRRFDRRWEWERLNDAQHEVEDFLSGRELSRTIMVRCQP